MQRYYERFDVMIDVSTTSSFDPENTIFVLPDMLNEATGHVTKGGTYTAKSMALLNKYLSGALKQMEGQPRNEWKEAARQQAETADQADFSMTDIKVKSKEIKNTSKQFKKSTQAAYALDVTQSRGKTGLLGAFVLSVAAGTAFVLGEPEAAGTAVIASIAYPKAKAYMNALLAPKTPETMKELSDYEELKRTQIALKALKEEFKKTDKLFKDDSITLWAMRNRPASR